jgi:dipeptidyl aminopeptidase/acylaminoacyl peptidase
VLCFDIPTTDYSRLATDDFASVGRWGRGERDPIKHRILDTLRAAIDELNQGGVIDPNRVGITGLSYGAETVGFAITNMPRLRAAIASSGLGWNPIDYYVYGPVARGILGAWGVGAPEKTPERWREFGFSPNATRVRAPVLLNVADHELLNAVQPVMSLQDANKAVEMHVFLDEYHIKWQPAHRLAIYQRNIDWMNFWLRGIEDASPEKVEQYRRWRAMRTLTEALPSDVSPPIGE